MSKKLIDLYMISESYEKIKLQEVSFLFEEAALEKKLASMDKNLHEGFLTVLININSLILWIKNINTLFTKYKNMFRVKKGTDITELVYNDRVTERLISATGNKNITVGTYETETYNTFCNEEEKSIKIRYPRKFDMIFSEDEITALCLQMYYVKFRYGLNLGKDILRITANIVFRLVFTKFIAAGKTGFVRILLSMFYKATYIAGSIKEKNTIENGSLINTYYRAIEKADRKVFSDGYGNQLKTALHKLNIEMGGKLREVYEAPIKEFENEDIDKMMNNVATTLNMQGASFSDRINFLDKLSQKKTSALNALSGAQDIQDVEEKPKETNNAETTDSVLKKLKLAIAK